jgi:hypothetical protein
MLRRHWLLLLCWVAMFLAVVIGIAVPGTDHALLGMPFLVSPIVALVTLSKVFRRKELEPLGHRWTIAHRILTGGCVALAIGGLVGSASQLVEVAGSTRMENGPMALLFLLGLVGSWAAFVRPSPRNTAVPAAIVHVAWLPLFFINQKYEPAEFEGWQKGLSALGLLGLLGLSALAAMIALSAFAGAPSRVPEARQLS